MITIEWEDVQHKQAGYIYRAKVVGGWLVKHVDDVRSPVYSGYDNPPYDHKEGYEWRGSICYIPDANHEWK